MDELNGFNAWDEPRTWRPARGVAYAELPAGVSVRPPLLSPWECERVAALGNQEVRDRWLATRALAKAVVRDQTDRRGIIEIRDGDGGRLIVYEGGFPVSDLWVSTVRGSERIAVLVSERPAGLAFRRFSEPDAQHDSIIDRREMRVTRVLFRDVRVAAALAWALKDAALECLRRSGARLADVKIGSDLRLHVGDRTLRPLAVRAGTRGITAVAVPARAGDPDGPLLIVDEAPSADGTPVPRLRDSIDRQLARARRILDARARRRPGWHPG